MKKILYILVLACLSFGTSCRRGPQVIPEKTLREIMRDALVSQAILHVDRAGKPNQLPPDSMDIHTAVLARYGYTIDDFRYTIRELSMRKSNPMANILGQVAEDIKISRQAAEQRYREVLRVDSIAQARTADTVWRSDTVVRGRLEGYRFAYADTRGGQDSLVPAGTYRLVFDYSTGGHARSYTKSVRTKRTTRSGQTIETTLWLPPARDTTGYEGEIRVGGETRSLEVIFGESVRRDLPPDTCYLTRLRLVHILPTAEARAALQRQITGFPDNIEAYYDEIYYDTLGRSGGTDAGRTVPPRIGR
ncbi:MAG: hypothetical protein K2G93_00905 [Rikenella sp.]|nr:hypothetical protein [Rikenella sp.]